MLDALRELDRTVDDRELRDHLALFLFCGDDIEKPVAELSGGEKQRLSLARMTRAQFDLLCLDINMPKLDGQRAVQLLREMEPDDGPKTVVFMISGDSTADNVIDARVKGQCAAFLVKPIDKNRLIEALKASGLISEDSGEDSESP